MARNLYREVTDRILAQLKSGTVPWVRPWKDIKGTGAAPLTLPRNAATNRLYSGVNIILLWMAADTNGWADGRYLTFKQAKEAGGTVRAGEHGTQIVFMKRITVRDRDAAPDEISSADKEISMMRGYTVFNIAQCDNLPARMTGIETTAPLPLDEPVRDEYADFIDATGATIVHGGNQPSYIPSLDQIRMPTESQFESQSHYRSTLAHELTHWTGTKDRCDRPFRNRFGDSAYALEELVAELGSAIICAEFGIEGRLQHADYIGHWIKALSEHEKAFFAAASAASKAVDFLRATVTAEETDEAEPLALAA